MKKIALAALASVAVLGLSACAKSNNPDAQASADTADMPADEAMNSVEASAVPVPDKGAAADAAASDAADPGKTDDDAKTAAEKTAKDFNDLGGDDAKPAAPPKN